MDSSQVSLPSGLAETWRGAGWCSGFLSVARCRQAEQRGLDWLTRVSAHMGVVDAQHQYWSLAAYLQQQPSNLALLDQPLALTHQRHPFRLLALRLPEAVAQARLERLQAACQRRTGRLPSPETVALCQWRVLATNAPPDRLTADQALLLYRARWQIEVLFKLWKQHGALDTWRTTNPQRIQTEVYAKLLMVLVQHWLLVETRWQFTDRSLVKARRWLCRHVFSLVKLLHQPMALQALLTELAEGMVMCRVTKRRKHPACFQLFDLLLDLD